MLNPLQGMANIADKFHSRAQTGETAMPIQAAKEQLGVETKYVDVAIQVRGLAVLVLVPDLRRWASSLVRRICPGWRSLGRQTRSSMRT